MIFFVYFQFSFGYKGEQSLYPAYDNHRVLQVSVHCITNPLIEPLSGTSHRPPLGTSHCTKCTLSSKLESGLYSKSAHYNNYCHVSVYT